MSSQEEVITCLSSGNFTFGIIVEIVLLLKL